ncbi:MAG TPA: hypothetical protein VK779_00980 [Rhizomicrobium sp.]|jgi:hypothetical protein|nr:hypothetical protein [Rhizomicrobium sp.]
MNIVAKIAAGVMLGIAASLLLLFGLAWGGYAIFLSFADRVGLAWAAAITAFIFLFVPVIVIAIAAIARPKPKPKEGFAAIVEALASVAKEKPFFGILAAGLFGAAEVAMNRWRRRKDR